MNEFGRQLYGHPCRECGFSWDLPGENVQVLIASLPERYAEALRASDGRDRFGDAAWCAGSYLWHVVDNVRIWAERIVASALADQPITPYDQDELAAARAYESLNVRAGLWALDRATADWRAANELAASQANVVLRHGEMGELSVEEAARMVAHDAHHHLFDIERARRA
jgi:uncharacterized damage-inducible protein DinB